MTDPQAALPPVVETRADRLELPVEGPTGARREQWQGGQALPSAGEAA